MTAAAVSLQSLPFGSVVTWDVEPGAYCSAHERETRAHFARRLATLKGYAYAGDCGGRAGPSLRADAPRTYGGHVYFVPSGTVTEPVRARAMGIAGADDLFGGVVEFAFVATKAITHPLPDADAARPAGWSTHFGHAVAGAVLAGFSAFSPDEARRAGRRLLEAGAVRVKPVRATGGRGQTVAHDTAELDRQLDALDAGELAAHGVVIEENLRDPDTFSVGQVVVDELTVSYHGRQRMTRDNAGLAVYGGSDLMLARGGFDDLLAARDLSAPLRAAIDQARRYHQAVRDGFPGFFASRVNYDVAQGRNAAGHWRSGVLEQSWRVGGATGAEIAALEVFRRAPERRAVRASTFEVYGAAMVPPQAIVAYRGEDPELGPLAKYALIQNHDSDTT